MQSLLLVVINYYCYSLKKRTSHRVLNHQIRFGIKKNSVSDYWVCILYTAVLTKLPTFFRGNGAFREKPSIPEYTSFEIGKTGIIPVSVLTFQYRIGNTSTEGTLLL
jgi:hypothetical protein